jgi:hypothetical protein
MSIFQEVCRPGRFHSPLPTPANRSEHWRDVDKPFHMLHVFLSCSQCTMKYKAFKHPLDLYKEQRHLLIHESAVYLFVRNIVWGRYDDTIEHWIEDMAVPAPMSSFHRGQTYAQRTSTGFDNFTLNNSAIGDNRSPPEHIYADASSMFILKHGGTSGRCLCVLVMPTGTSRQAS